MDDRSFELRVLVNSKKVSELSVRVWSRIELLSSSGGRVANEVQA